MDQRFLIETLEQRPMLFHAMLEFNRHSLSSFVPEPEALPAWPALCKDASFLKAFRRRTSVSVSGFWDFEEESTRLALLPEETLHGLSLYFSAAVHAEAITGTLLRPQVLALRKTIGEGPCTYALKRGRYQIGSLRTVLTGLSQEGSLPEKILHVAAVSLAIVAADWPSPLQERCSVWKEVPDMPLIPRGQRRALWFTMKKILLREVAPQWAPCFN